MRRQTALLAAAFLSVVGAALPRKPAYRDPDISPERLIDDL